MLQLTGVILHGVGPYYTKNRLPISNLTLISGVNGSGKSSWFKVIDALRDSWKHKPAIADISEQVANAKEFRNEDFIHIGSLHFPWYLGLDASGVTRPATEANGIRYDPSVVPRLINEHVVAENDGRSLEQINLSPNNRRPVFELEFCATEATVHLDAAQVDDTNLSDLEALLVLGVCRRGRRITVSLQHCAYGETNLYRRLALSVNSEQIAWESTAPAHQVRFDLQRLIDTTFSLSSTSLHVEPSIDHLKLTAQRIDELFDQFMHNYFDVQAIRAFGQSKYFDAHMDEVEQGLKLQKRIRLRREYFAKHVSQDGQQADELELNEIEQQELDLAIAKLLGVESKLHDGRRRYINQFLFAPGFEGKFSTGFHQVFPIIVQCVKMKAGEILALENPEVHLHPDLQLKFAEYLLEQSKVGKRIMIETHSDLIIRRMMRAVLAEEVPQNHISLNFCRMQKLDNGITTAVVEPYGVDANGRIRWPEGFMDESIAESDRLLEVMYAMRKRRDGGDE